MYGAGGGDDVNANKRNLGCFYHIGGKGNVESRPPTGSRGGGNWACVYHNDGKSITEHAENQQSPVRFSDTISDTSYEAERLLTSLPTLGVPTLVAWGTPCSTAGVRGAHDAQILADPHGTADDYDASECHTSLPTLGVCRRSPPGEREVQPQADRGACGSCTRLLADLATNK